MTPAPAASRPRAPTRRRALGALALGALALGAALALAACTTGTDPQPSAVAGHDDCQTPSASADRDDPGSFEDANLLAAGEMFRLYGADADPLRTQVTGEAVDVDGQPVWRLDTEFAVTVDGERRTDTWTIWIGFADAGLTVLCAHGPPDITWPPDSLRASDL